MWRDKSFSEQSAMSIGLWWPLHNPFETYPFKFHSLSTYHAPRAKQAPLPAATSGYFFFFWGWGGTQVGALYPELHPDLCHMYNNPLSLAAV